MNYLFSSNYSFKIKLNGWQGVLVSYLVFLFISIIFTFVSFVSLANGQINLAKVFLTIAQPITKVTSIATFGSVPLIEFWEESVSAGRELIFLTEDERSLNSFISQDKSKLIENISLMSKQANRSWLLKIIAKKNEVNFEDFSKLIEVASLIEKERIDGKKYLLIFQNSDEIRATGGFMGSYAVLDFSKDNPLEINIRDIYDPSGISKRKSAPVGHDQFLSGGEGMALHDANWDPDFPKSAKDILWFFENIESDPQFYDGVIAINFSSIEKVVGWLGEIYLPDEGEFVSAYELADVLRSDRSEFFAGSKQKTQQLSAFQTALMLKFDSLSMSEKVSFAKNFLASRTIEEIQFFSKSQNIEEGFEKLNLAGNLNSYLPSELFIFPVESNVGVNKANRWIARSIKTEKNEELLRITTTFNNHATISDRPEVDLSNKDYETASHLGYVNYYRFITSPNLELISVKSGIDVLNSWDKERIIATNGLEYIQYGFLVVVPESTQKEVFLDFVVSGDGENLTLQEQAGLFYEKDRVLIEEVQ
jgi:hypothetical protein